MAGTDYKIYAWGPRLEAGATDKYYTCVQGISKRATERQPYVVFNDLVCSDLARTVRLPVPPSFTVTGQDGEKYHVSLDFNLAGESLPPVDPEQVLQAQHSLACGVILFDIWVATKDRHKRNIAFFEEEYKLQLFDFTHALVGPRGNRIQNVGDKPGIDGNHCLANHVQSLAPVRDWYRRIKEVPEWMIREAVPDGRTLGVEAGKTHECIDFLLQRRERLLDLIQDHPGEFPNVSGEEIESLQHEQEG